MCAACIRFGKFDGTLQDAHCPVSGEGSPSVLVFRGRDSIGYYRCLDCGIQYASPRFTEESLMRIYETEAFADLAVFDDFSYDKWKARADRTYHTQKKKVALARSFLPEGARLLDVGCGAGLFLIEAGHEGFVCEGVEPSSMLSDIARNVVGVNVSTVTLDDFRPESAYDGVFIWDVLEHLYDPVSVLARCAELLAPGGYVFCQVPNHAGLGNRVTSALYRLGLKRSGDFKHFGFPWHVYSFHRRSLGALMARSGFEPVMFESWPHSIKEGRGGMLADVLRRLCLSDYIVGVARRPE